MCRCGQIISIERHSCRPHVSYFRNQLRRATMAKYFEVMDHVHLVVVAEAVCDVQPCPLRSRYFGIQSSLEAGNPGKRFWRSACLLAKFACELSQSDRTVAGKIRDLHCAMLMEDVFGDSDNHTSHSRAGCVIHEKFLADKDPFLKRDSFSQPVPQCADRRADYSFRITPTVCKLRGWNTEQVHKTSWPEEYSECLNTASQMHVTRKMSLCASYGGSISQQYPSIRPPHLGRGSEIEHKDLFQLRCGRLHYQRTAVTNLALSKRSYIWAEFHTRLAHV